MGLALLKLKQPDLSIFFADDIVLILHSAIRSKNGLHRSISKFID